MSPNIRTSELVKAALKQIKEDGDHTNYDSAVREVLREAGVDIHEYKHLVEDGDEEESSSLGWAKKSNQEE